MQLKDYYARLGLDRHASPDDVKRAYRKLARKYHPDVSKEPDAEAQFKDVAAAYEVLKDPERRAAYDAAGAPRSGGTDSQTPHRWPDGFEFSQGSATAGQDPSAIFEALFGGRASGPRGSGDDQHVAIQIDLQDAYRGGRRTVFVQVPTRDALGAPTLQQRQLDIHIPPGIREGQHLRLKGQGEPGHGAAPAGDLYLEVHIKPDALFRLDGRDVYFNLPVAPWEAVLGASVTAPAPDGSVQLTIPAGSASGRKLRLRGKGLPGTPPGDLYAVLSIALPPAADERAATAYRTLASSFQAFDPRAEMGAVKA